MLRLAPLAALLLLPSGCTMNKAGPQTPLSTFRNSLGMEFVQLPGGTFLMGSDKSGVARPVHQVTLSSFFISRHEVTNAQFEAFRKIKRPAFSPDADMPVMGATRAEVIAFVEWLSERDGRRYLLPTEAQSEYAARGGREGLDFPWGPRWRDGMANIGGEETSARATPVGSFPPNGFGLYDMVGNASEMVRERYADYTPGPKVDPVGLVQEPSEEPFVIRGLGIKDLWPWVWYRSMSFDNLPPDTEGFRLVVEEN